MYICLGMDVYHGAKPVRNIGSKVRVPQLPFAVPDVGVPKILM